MTFNVFIPFVFVAVISWYLKSYVGALFCSILLILQITSDTTFLLSSSFSANGGVYLLILSSLLVGLFGRFFGRLGVIVLVGIASYEVFLFALFLWYYVNFGVGTVFIKLGVWVENPVCVNWEFVYDPVSTTLFLLVAFIAVIVKFFSFDYMHSDPHLVRFLLFLLLFTLTMCLLLSAANLIQLFLGWEGVGLCSYLLVNFWFTRPAANKSALKALLVNRVSDCGVFLALMLCFASFRSFDFSTIFALIPFVTSKVLFLGPFSFGVLNVLASALFFGAVGKSAQLGLHIWLPDAMEGPTPVSALLHAATMVTAGVFLLIRCSPVLEYTPSVLLVIAFLGTMTTLVAGTIGLVEFDLKKIIAYSTCSQLGYMVCVCGFSGYSESLFHLVLHAFFKALLFLCAGNVIHALGGEQDIRRMGNLKNVLPVTYMYMVLASFALGGFPFLAGYYSKDFILEYILHVPSYHGVFIFWVGSFSACLTGIYSIRLLVSVFTSSNFNYRVNRGGEASSYVLLGLFPLAVGSIFGGYCLKDLFIGFNSLIFSSSVNVATCVEIVNNIEFTATAIKLYPTLLSLLGMLLVEAWCWVGSIFYDTNYQNEMTRSTLFSFQTYWYFDILYIYFLGLSLVENSYWALYKNVDRGFLETVGPTFILKSNYALSRTVSEIYVSNKLNFLVFFPLFLVYCWLLFL